MCGGDDVTFGDERAAAPQLLPVVAVEVDRRHPGPLAGTGDGATHDPKLRGLGHSALCRRTGQGHYPATYLLLDIINNSLSKKRFRKIIVYFLTRTVA